MSTQRYISTSFWDDVWVQGLNITEKALYLYLLTNTLTNIAGIYKISDKRICFDTGISEIEAKAIMGKFETDGKVYRKGEYLVLPNWPKHQKWENHKTIKAGIEAVLKTLSTEFIIFLKEKGYAYPLNIVDDSQSVAMDSQRYPMYSLSEPIDSLSEPIGSQGDPPRYSDLDLNIDLDSDLNLNSDSPSEGVCASTENPQVEKNPQPLKDTTKPEKLFLEIWQHTPDVFNVVGRIESHKEWANFWAITPLTTEQVKTALDNFIQDVRCGVIEQRYVPTKPDRFVLNGWLTKCRQRFKGKETSANRTPHRIAADNISPDKLDEYFS